jgi:hypothetical protein
METDMTSLEILDPTRPDDPRFDPRGDQGRRVRAAATARAEPAPLPSPRRTRPRRLAPALATAAVAAAAAVVLLPTGASDDARAALQQAAERTAAIESGRVIWTLRADPPGPVRSADRSDIHFSGGDLEWRARGHIVLEDGRRTETALTYREIGDDGYVRDDSEPGAEFTKGPATAESDFPHQVVRHFGSEALVALVRGAADFSARPAAGGATVYLATVTAGEVFDAAPTAAGRAQGGAWRRPVTLEVTVSEAGLIERVVTSGEHETMTIEYRDLNLPQVIERPEARRAARGRGGS